MILYHASKNSLPTGKSLKTPTGRNDGDITTGGAVYMTDTPEACCRYGRVYKIQAHNAISYKKALQAIGRNKKSRYTRGVFVAKPQNTKILGVIL